jgi:di/tricarboxylate transporter
MSPDWHALATLVIAVLTFWGFANERWPVQTTALVSVLALMLVFGVLPPRPGIPVLGPADFLAGFGHPALVTICCLMVLGHGLVATGALEPAGRFLSRAFNFSPGLASLLMLVVCLMLSGVINDTPIVVLMMPVLLAVAARTRVAASQTLLPMNYAVLIGGMATTIGTSTNLLVVGLAEDLGVKPFGVFEFTPLVIVAAAVALPYLWLVVPRLLPRGSGDQASVAPLTFSVLAEVRAGGFSDGRALDAPRFKAEHFSVLTVRRDGVNIHDGSDIRLQAGDILLLETPAELLREHAATLGLEIQGVRPLERGDAANQVLAQVMVTGEGSSISGSGAQQFVTQTNLALLGMHRAEGDPEDPLRTVLRHGDILLVQGSRQTLDAVKNSPGLLVLDATMEIPHTNKAPVALLIMAAVIAAAASGTLPMVLAAALGVAAMMVSGCLRWKDASAALSSNVIMIVMASLALGVALTATGLIQSVGDGLAWLGGRTPPVVSLAMLMLLMAGLTNFVSNNAAAIIGTPIAVSMATTLGLDPQPFVLAVLFGCNLCYATPMGYQTNLLVMSAAGYRFKDFVRAGLPLLVLMWVTLTILLAMRYGINGLF